MKDVVGTTLGWVGCAAPGNWYTSVLVLQIHEKMCHKHESEKKSC